MPHTPEVSKAEREMWQKIVLLVASLLKVYYYIINIIAQQIQI